MTTTASSESRIDLSKLGSSDITPDNQLRGRGQRSAVYLILERGDFNNGGEILMLQRANTGYMDGQYSFVAGHIEFGEPVIEAMIREAFEEAGITLTEADLRFAHVCHRKSDDDLIYYDFFFRASTWRGEVTNTEPDRCSDLSWFAKNALPQKAIPYIRGIIDLVYTQEESFSEYNWVSGEAK